MTDIRPDHLHLLIRAYSTPVEDEAETSKSDGVHKSRGRIVARIGPAPISLTFDLETTVDAAMRVRVGFYQLHVEDRLDEEGIIYDPREAFPGDVNTIFAYAAARGLATPITVESFRRKIFKLYGVGGQIIGFNLPFDLSRIAMGTTAAKANKWNKKMRGAHSLALSASPYDPRIQIKHLNPRAALIEYTVPNRGRARSSRERRDKVPARRGTFIDVRTLAGAMFSGSFSLERLTAKLKTPTQKTASHEHGQHLTFDYLDYARTDVQATWECYLNLRERYARYGLSAPLASIRSEAGIGKAILTEMGIANKADPNPDKIARCLHTYYGGRTEAHLRRKIVRVVQTDFTSMYPTGCTLQNLWRFVIADHVSERDATEEARQLLAKTTPADWQDPSAWPDLTMLVRVQAGLASIKWRDSVSVSSPFFELNRAEVIQR